MPRLRLALGLAICICAFPASALGAVVRIDGGNTLVYQAAVGEGNSPFIEQQGSNLVVTENVLVLTPGPGCSQGASPQEVVCPAAGITKATVDCGDGQDGAQMAVALDTTMFGGEGQDTLTGGGGDDNLIGESGPDAINGGDGRDAANYSDHTAAVTVDIGGGNNDGNLSDEGVNGRDNVNVDVEDLIGGQGGDQLTGDAKDNGITGGPGADQMFGGTGIDTARYSDHAEDVVVDIGGGANDGNASDGAEGARDDVSGDIEDLRGGGGNDVLGGNAGGNAIAGGRGNDTLKGGDGPDSLIGEEGGDTADYSDHTEGVTVDIGGGANDGNGADGPPGARDDVGADVENLRGGAGGDSLGGSPGPNALDGGGGDDQLDGGLGADSMGGGGGTDRVAYESRSGNVQVTMDGVPGDGEAGEGDNVGGDVENVTTGSGADSVEGNASGNTVESGGGEDYVDGAGGGDALGAGTSKDTVRSRDGASDTVFCGPDVDFAIADAGDKVASDCERIDRGVRNVPRLAREVVVSPRGTVAMNLPGVRRFVPLKDRVNLPVRTTIDASRVSVRMTSATGRARRTQAGVFSRGAFRVTQGQGRQPVTTLTLMGGDFSSCPRAAEARVSQSSRRRTVRRLFSNARGRFRSRGRFSSATVRGTKWEMHDRCDGTLTIVRRGSVVVFDQVRKRRVVVKAGRRYLARAR